MCSLGFLYLNQDKSQCQLFLIVLVCSSVNFYQSSHVTSKHFYYYYLWMCLLGFLSLNLINLHKQIYNLICQCALRVFYVNQVRQANIFLKIFLGMLVGFFIPIKSYVFNKSKYSYYYLSVDVFVCFLFH
jgi:hypothetical protein